MMRNDQLILVQEHVGNRDRFIQQTAGIAAQVEHQAIELGGVQMLSAPRPVRVSVVFVESRRARHIRCRVSPRKRRPRSAWEFHRA